MRFDATLEDPRPRVAIPALGRAASFMTQPQCEPQSGLPIGPPVDATPAPHPARVTLEGHWVRLEPLVAERHAASLFADTHGADAAARFQYLFEAPFADEAAFHAHLTGRATSVDPLFFAIIERLSGRALGQATLMRIEPAHRVLEVGNILYGRSLARTPGATEAQYLLMRYVFDALGYRRYEWKCNALNAPSHRAALRLGFSFEGVFRSHMIVRGRSRDTAWYSLIDTDWPRVGAALSAWLAPANFDAAGRQRQRLEALRAP